MKDNEATYIQKKWQLTIQMTNDGSVSIIWPMVKCILAYHWLFVLYLSDLTQIFNLEKKISKRIIPTVVLQKHQIKEYTG